ncbi:metallophosphoesterase [Actibacterium sp. MT2.3-13A]|uniref:metallophosphoesterase n=1 Tax=Actibacterium sp. MT2.3-13A TaxID=2828332 RepID=UPI001BA6BEC0|nr:metallophosphoesterase [Actibacterium sp. MT2.3-13A]
MRSYAIGDSHGHLDHLREVHRRIAADRARLGDEVAPVVHLGDYVDRGPDSRGVLAFLLQGLAEGRNWVLLKGNHDRMMALFLRAPEERDPRRPDLHWLEDRIGGRATLASYGVDVSPDRPAEEIHEEARRLVPPAHVALLEGLRPSYARDGVFFCHAGIRPGLALAEQSEDDLVWIRGEFHDDRRDHGALIVHGHTPVERVTHYGNRLNLDTGAAYGGPVSAVVIEGGAVFELTEEGRRAIRPPRWVFRKS